MVNTHRGVIYEQRDKVLAGSNIRNNVQEMVEKELTAILDGFLQGVRPDDWDVEGLIAELGTVLPLDEKLSDPDAVFEMPADAIYDEVLALATRRYDQMEEIFTTEVMRHVERAVMLRVIDSHWVQHLTSMENLRQGIGLYSYGQRDPPRHVQDKGLRAVPDTERANPVGRRSNDLPRPGRRAASTARTLPEKRAVRRRSRQVRSGPKGRTQPSERGIKWPKALPRRTPCHAADGKEGQQETLA